MDWLVSIVAAPLIIVGLWKLLCRWDARATRKMIEREEREDRENKQPEPTSVEQLLKRVRDKHEY